MNELLEVLKDVLMLMASKIDWTWIIVSTLGTLIYVLNDRKQTRAAKMVAWGVQAYLFAEKWKKAKGVTDPDVVKEKALDKFRELWSEEYAKVMPSNEEREAGRNIENTCGEMKKAELAAGDTQ